MEELLVLAAVTFAAALGCPGREPELATARTPGDHGFRIRISSGTDTYVPTEMYTVNLHGNRSATNIQKFTGFFLMVEPKDAKNDLNGPGQVGYFQLFGDALSQFAEECPNAVRHASDVPKSELQVMWTAPPPGSGCVVFKATVVESSDLWYMDDGRLTKILCEEEQEDQDKQPEVLEECCACDEAKYELTFEGVWSRHTHPKNFPVNEWLTYFSDIIGASHTPDFRIWKYGGLASEGVRQVAEWGATKKLESELKMEATKIRTIIKARGLWYPNVNRKTFAVFRVDRRHHLMSILSMLGPSPDWIVGVSGLELCQRNCSWLPAKVMNLYPWDAGTDSGTNYTSANIPTVPQESIRRITSSHPAHPDSPFYDPSGTPMKPVARLKVARQRVYDKPCDDPPISEIPSGVADCAVTEWSPYSRCSVSCGQGTQIRTRTLLMDVRRTRGCDVSMAEKIPCTVSCESRECETTPWGPWEPCSASCGRGLRTRTRKYASQLGKKLCSLDLMQKEVCSESACETPVPTTALVTTTTTSTTSRPATEPSSPKGPCEVTQWSEWSPCTVTCGRGTRVRTRLYLVPSVNSCDVSLQQESPCVAGREDCTLDPALAAELCLLPKNPGPCRGYYPRWYYDPARGQCLQFAYGGCRGNRNNFRSHSDCNRMCEIMLRDRTALSHGGGGGGREEHSPACGPVRHSDQPVIDCVVTPWSPWTACSRSCGGGRRERRRMVLLNPENGGRPCPRKLVQRRKCKDNPPCDGGENRGRRKEDRLGDCIQTPWEDWSPCSVTCGTGGTQKRSRRVRRRSSCGTKTESRPCPRLPTCRPE